MVYDIFIIGGGINGVGIARDAVGRGFDRRRAALAPMLARRRPRQRRPLHHRRTARRRTAPSP